MTSGPSPRDAHGTPQWIALLCLGGSILAFASVPLFIRHFAAWLDPWTVNGVRYGTAAAIWLPIALLLWRRDPGSAGVWRAALIPGAVNTIGQIFWAITPYYNEAAVIGFAIRSSFVFTLLFGFLLLPEERRLARIAAFWVGVLICLVGLGIMYSSSLRSAAGGSPKGMSLIVITAVFWALYAISVKRCMARYSARLSFGVICVYTTLGLLPLMLWKGDVPALGRLPTPQVLLLCLSGVVGIAVSHVMLYKAIKIVGALVTSGVSLLTPFVTWLGAAIFLGEALTGWQCAGALTLVAGSLLLVRAQTRLPERARIDTGNPR